jgi:release factor glutamine methyltransferase
MHFLKQISKQNWQQVKAKELLDLGKAELATKDISPVDAELILAHFLGINRMELHSKSIDVDDELVIDSFKNAISERLTGKPTQYITGTAPFRYLDYEVGPGVLIPRPETEIMVDEVLHQLSKFDDPISIIDLGAGAGGISIALATETHGKKEVHVIAVEKSKDALAWLHKNITKHEVNVRVVEEGVETALMGVKCDVVVANPPYLPDEQVIPSELKFEPDMALFGGKGDGMDAPREFIKAASRLLKSGGLLAMEHNEVQGPLLTQELSTDFENIATYQDLNERPRFTTARRK